MPRIVSLIPSATEIVAALGFAADLVGRSHECDHPEGVAALPPLTAPKLPLDGDSGEIDRRVKRVLAEGLAVYRVDPEGLRALDPDVVVTQDQCQVCAASLAEVEAAMRDWTGRPVRVVSLNPMSLADAWADMARVAAALGVPDRGAELVGRLQARMARVAERAAGRPRPRVAVVEWIEPLMAGGNWMPTLVELAGGENLFGAAGRHSPWLEWDALVAADPDAILVAPCGFPISRSRADVPRLAARPGWRDLKAVRAGRVAIADGNQFFNRPGPRLVESLEILAEFLHPAAFDFGHRGAGWVPLD